MQDVQIICSYRHLAALVDQLREYCARTQEWQLAEVTDFVMSQKLSYARIHVSFPHQPVDPTLIEQLEADSRVIDFYIQEEIELDEAQLARLPHALLPHPSSVLRRHV